MIGIRKRENQIIHETFVSTTSFVAADVWSSLHTTAAASTNGFYRKWSELFHTISLLHMYSL
jgi:hypothetical protein